MNDLSIKEILKNVVLTILSTIVILYVFTTTVF